jgi:hypothetical protein
MTRENGQNAMENSVAVKRSMQERIIGNFAILKRTSRFEHGQMIMHFEDYSSI